MTRILIVVGMVLANLVAFAASAPQGEPDHASTFQHLNRAAERARSENRDDEAIRLYRQGLVVRPEWEEGLWYLGTLLYDAEHYADARDVLRRFVALREDAGPAWAFLGISEFQTREYSRALEHLQRAMALGMGDRNDLVQSVFRYSATLFTRLERYDDSMGMLARMIASDPNPTSLIEPAGLAGLRIPLLPSEIPAARRELIQMAGAAVVALQTQHYEDADIAFRRLETAYPSEPGVHFLYGAYLMQLHPEDGIRAMKRELEISPSHVLARVRLAAQYLEQQQVDEALPLAEQAAKLDPHLASAHMLLGEAYVMKGNLGEGTKELEAARDNDHASSRIHWDLARAYASAGRGDDARREKVEIEKLSRSGPGSDPAEDQKSEPAASK
jgi:tetratricopeptide (TPR) repeat protein